MQKIDLNNRVVIVTGSGRGIGRAYALLLAERGAAVVVNDLGTDPAGETEDSSIAELVVEDIRTKGGKAVADSNDVSTVDGANAVVEKALKSFGRLDAVVNNAGLYHAAPFLKNTFDDFERIWRVNVGGHYNVTKAAWPILEANGYGRIIMTGSGSGIYGVEEQSIYAASKGAIYGLTRALALEGRRVGIAVNAICPGGFTRMHGDITSEPDYQEMLDWTKNAMPPELVAPAAVWLASDVCTVSGQVFGVWAGRVVRVAVGSGKGYYNTSLTPESIMENYDEVVSLGDFSQPESAVNDILDWRAKWSDSSG